MKLVGRIPVEPLDDERLTNIERRIVAGASELQGTPARVRRPYLGFAAATFATAAAAGVLGWKLHRDPAPGLATAAKVAMHTDRQKSVLDIGDATIESSPNTTFGITRPDGGVLVEMTRGRIELEVAKRAGRPPLVVRAGETDVIVVGTHFIVDCGERCGGEVDVRVTEGVVRVVRHTQDTRVAAGNAWRPTTGVVAIADLPDRDEDAAVALVEPARVTDRAATGDVELEVGKGPDLRDHVAAVPDARIATSGSGANVRVGSNALAGGPELTRRPRTTEAASDSKIDLKTLIRQEPVAAPLEVTATTPAAAVAKYQQMLLPPKEGEQRSGEDESRAYYGIAYMQHIKLGRNGEALATIKNYLNRFSGGKRYPEYTAVLWLRVRIACLQLVATESCPEVATAYMKSSRNDTRVNVARLLAE